MVTAAAHKVEEVEGLEHDEREALRADVERVREVLQGSDVASNGTHGLAVYACGPAGLLEVIPLPHPIESRAVVDRRPCVEPLVRSGCEERWCVLLVNRRTARIFAGTADGLEELDQIEDDVHRQHDQGGWSQARFQRSVEQEKLNHLGRHARHAVHALQAGAVRPPRGRRARGARDRGRGAAASVPAPAAAPGGIGVDVENSTVAEVEAAAAEVVDRHVAAVEREALDRFKQGIGRGDRGAAGPDAVMKALEQARVEILLLAEDFDAPELDEAVEKAITQSAQVIVIRHHDDLVMHGGIGAVLRF